ncbi:MAG: phage baseplate assembly protein V [Oxalobacter sp.]|nr:phage baseplate assembly protein V [Oxalobacter sp.]
MLLTDSQTEDSTAEAANRLIKIGEVSSIDPARCTARVVFDDEDSLVSYDLPVIQRNTLETADYHMPSIGEDVLCIFPQGGDDGFIIGSWYAGEITPPAATEDIRMVKFKDGTVIQYDMASHTLTATIEGTELKADRQTVDITGTSTVNIKSATAINIESAVINLKMGGTTMRLDGGNAVIDTTDITFTGNARINGDLYVDGDSNVHGDIKASGTIKENQGV